MGLGARRAEGPGRSLLSRRRRARGAASDRLRRPPLGGLWRRRLAAANAAALARQAGRTEDEAALRDASYLRREGDDPGPGGRLLKGWRRLGERDPMQHVIRLALQPMDWMPGLSADLDLRVDGFLLDIGDAAKKLAQGEGSAISAAAQIAAVSMQKRPDAEPLALWLADVVLAHRLKWPAPVPLIAGEIRRSELRAAARDHDGDRACERRVRSGMHARLPWPPTSMPNSRDTPTNC